MNNLNDTQDLIESQNKMIALFEVLFAIEQYIRDPDPAIIVELEEKTLELFIAGIMTFEEADVLCDYLLLLLSQFSPN